MNKKKRCRRGQVTIFIILGLVLLFVFIFLYMLKEGIQVSELEEAKEDVISKAFRKEALRLYVDECLNIFLEEGLIRLGMQGGRIWDKEGGRDAFVEGETGITYVEKVSYAITNKKYSSDNQYPCKEGEPPAFCRYKYPNSSSLFTYPVKFGEIELKRTTIERDLKKFLIDETVRCVEEKLRENWSLSRSVNISAENIEVALDILSSGISVEVNYPLILSLGEEEFFHLAEFSFFYDSDFKKFLDVAVIHPLSLDRDFVDFEYTEESLKTDPFIHAEGMGEDKKEITIRGDEYVNWVTGFSSDEQPNGDWIFKFTTSAVFEHGGLYTFQFARQNRPPALDYIERDGCDEDGYDYLVIPGDDELGAIDITLSSDVNLFGDAFLALDPEEDEVISYNFGTYGYDLSQTNPLIQPFIFENQNNFLATPTEDQVGYHNITLIATDEHGASDWQEVRVLVDREMKTEVSLDMPYMVPYEGSIVPYDQRFTDKYWISNEDPVFIKVTIPEESLTGQDPDLINLSYKGEGIVDLINLLGGKGCFNFPWYEDEPYTCSIDDYTLDEFDLPTGFDFSPFETAETGELSLNFAITYCGKNEQESKASIDVAVRGCVPHVNKTHPYPYMPDDEEEYYKHLFVQDDEENWVDSGETEEINPFLATHSCCGDWELKDTTDICFEDPVPGCYGGAKLPDGSIDPRRKAGFILEERKRHCDNVRGNICGGAWSYTIGTEEYPNTPVCGDYDKNHPECFNTVPPDCRGEPAWSVIKGVGWCYGDVGCENFCKEDGIVYTMVGDPSVFPTRTEYGFKCGCDQADIDNMRLCDGDFDGEFDEFCLKYGCAPRMEGPNP